MIKLKACTKCVTRGCKLCPWKERVEERFKSVIKICVIFPYPRSIPIKFYSMFTLKNPILRNLEELLILLVNRLNSEFLQVTLFENFLSLVFPDSL